MSVTVSAVTAALEGLVDPVTQRTWASAKAFQNIQVQGDAVSLDWVLGYPAQSLWAQGVEAITQAVQALPGVRTVQVQPRLQVQSHAAQRGVALIDGVKNIIAVASGKGGVGKSTTAANLALALAAEGARVGLLDADIYGPSQPTMMGVSGQPETQDGKMMEPMMAHGVQVMSIGFLVDPDQAMIWRGPMASQALDQLLRQTRWDNLDYLVVDMPPGTGDIQLSLSQKVPITGSVIVTTPQDIALLDARKGVAMFEKVSVPILGIVENMAVHVCSNCGHAEHIFGTDGGKNLAQQGGYSYLGALPLAMHIREQADSGRPTVVADPQGTTAALYRGIAHQVAAKVALQSKDYSSKFPTITISKNS